MNYETENAIRELAKSLNKLVQTLIRIAEKKEQSDSAG